jgi:hypothetical protein
LEHHTCDCFLCFLQKSGLPLFLLLLLLLLLPFLLLLLRSARPQHLLRRQSGV